MAKSRVDEPNSGSEPRTLTEVEWTIMNVVWRLEPCAAGTVQDELQTSHNWAYSTIKTTMDRMVAKGLLATHAIRNLNLFTSLVNRDQAQRSELKQFLHRAFDGAVAPMLQFLVDHEDLSDDEIQQLRKLIRKSSDKKS